MPDDLDTYATFHEEGTLASGDPFTKPKHKSGRSCGKQFTVVGTTTPKESPLGLHIPFTVPGDTYVEPAKLQLELEKRSGTPVSSRPFMPGSGRILSSGAGSLYGTFGPPRLLLDTDASMANRRPGTAPAKGRRNIYVNPPCTGGPGRMVQDNTIGGTKFDYMPDEYCRGRKLEREMKREARARIAKPFVASSCASHLFRDIPSLAATPGDPTHVRASTAPPCKTPGWRPANPPRKGSGHGTINRLEYVPCPIRQAEYHAKGRAAVRPFKPVGGTHNRLSMWTVNPYSCDERSPQDNNLSLL